MHKVLIHPAGYDDCREAIDKAFELFPVDLAGKKILVKPNVLRSSEPEEGIVTHPAVLRAVVEKLEASRPASIVVGDNPGMFSYGANEDSFRRTGLMEAANGHYRNIGTEAVEVQFNPAFEGRVSVSTQVLEADVVISLPKFKTHGLTAITGAVKNSYGILPGAQKARLHFIAGNPWRFGELIVDVFGLRVPELFIVDAVVGMEGNGPASKDLRQIGKIMASDNAVALDATIARMMGLNPRNLRFLQVAKKQGFGDDDENAIEVVGEFEKIPDFKLPPIVVKAEEVSMEIRELIRSRTLVRPSVDPDLCTGCETCIEQCPASALSMKQGMPEVDAEKCITCFCCQEMCPEAAITLR
jgi:uncharacterized protein (DUF362 family)/NAD-dependent dihydropyrimidine dehydrogenase PreA subunit